MSLNEVIELGVGELVLSDKPIVIDTTLDSSVLVSLFSEKSQVGGIVHFSHPDKASLAGTHFQKLQVGEEAVAFLIDEFTTQFSCAPHFIVAKIAGGANLPSVQDLGQRNVEVAKKILRARKIMIVGESVGQSCKRRAIFHPQSGRLQIANLDQPLHKPSPNTSAAPNEPKEQKRKRRVLVVDDAKVIRDLLTKVLNEDPELEVVGTAADPFEADKLVEQLNPDVITLDVHMPGMDGPTYLEKLLPRRPIPVVMITAISMEQGDYVLRSLELGAVDYIQKPSMSELKTVAPIIQDKVKQASHVKVKYKSQNRIRGNVAVQGQNIDQNIILAIGASTGGTEAIREVLQNLPENIPPIVMVQHIPPVFSTAFANRLDSLCPFKVKEAENGDEVLPGRVLLAPGGKQMAIISTPTGYKVKVNDDPPVNRHRPSVDYLFNSVAQLVKAKAVGVILTGMGNDGAAGLLRMKQAGAKTIGQNEDTCIVYGMPRAAFEMGAVGQVCPLPEISNAILRTLQKRKAA